MKLLGNWDSNKEMRDSNIEMSLHSRGGIIQAGNMEGQKVCNVRLIMPPLVSLVGQESTSASLYP